MRDGARGNGRVVCVDSSIHPLTLTVASAKGVGVDSQEWDDGVLRLESELRGALARVAELEAAIRTVFDEIDMRHIEKHDEDTAHELHALKWVLKKEGGS